VNPMVLVVDQLPKDIPLPILIRLINELVEVVIIFKVFTLPLAEKATLIVMCVKIGPKCFQVAPPPP